MATGMAQNMATLYPLIEHPKHPEIEVPIACIIDDAENVILLIPDCIDLQRVRNVMAPNYQRMVMAGRPISCHHDPTLKKYRLAPKILSETSGNSGLNLAFHLEAETIDKAKIKRPRNAWIIYRCAKSEQMRLANPALNAATISTEVAIGWARESSFVKEHYHSLAKDEQRLHQLHYPDYRYSPRKTKKAEL